MSPTLINHLINNITVMNRCSLCFGFLTFTETANFWMERPLFWFDTSLRSELFKSIWIAWHNFYQVTQYRFYSLFFSILKKKIKLIKKGFFSSCLFEKKVVLVLLKFSRSQRKQYCLFIFQNKVFFSLTLTIPTVCYVCFSFEIDTPILIRQLITRT